MRRPKSQVWIQDFFCRLGPLKKLEKMTSVAHRKMIIFFMFLIIFWKKENILKKIEKNLAKSWGKKSKYISAQNGFWTLPQPQK